MQLSTNVFWIQNVFMIHSLVYTWEVLLSANGDQPFRQEQKSASAFETADCWNQALIPFHISVYWQI